MSALATGRAGARRRHDERGRPRPAGRERGDERARGMASLFDDLGGESTLDTLVSGAWEGLAAHQPVPCPMCGGEMTPDYAVHPLPIGGGCRSCGTMLT